MRYLVPVGACAILVCAAAFLLPTAKVEPVQAAEDIKKPARSITTNGTATVKAHADSARIVFAYWASDPSLKVAKEAIEKQTKKVRDGLDALKFNIDIKLSAMEITHGFNQGGGFGPPVFATPARGENDAVPVPVIPRSSTAVNAPLPAPEVPPPVQAPNPAPVPVDPGGSAPGIPGQPGAPPANFMIAQVCTVILTNDKADKLLEQTNKILLTLADGGVLLNNSSIIVSQNFGGFIPGAPKVTFFISNDGEIRRTAMTFAVADALANAKALASGADVKVLETTQILADQGNTLSATATGSNLGDPLVQGPGFAVVSVENLVGREITVRVTVVCGY